VSRAFHSSSSSKGRFGFSIPRSSNFELARLGPGEFFGEMALLNDKPRNATVEALEDVEVLVLEQDDCHNVLLEGPPVALQLIDGLSMRIRSADEHISTLSDKAMRDPLTGLLNHRAYRERIKEEVERAVRYAERFSLILLDLDQFKSINDTFGHDVGDVVLGWTGRLLTEPTRSPDTPFRIGGEAFAILAPSTGSRVAHTVTQRLVDVVAEARPPVDFELRVTMSGVYACCPDDTASPEALFSMADKALFRAKAEGHNRVGQPKTDCTSKGPISPKRANRTSIRTAPETTTLRRHDPCVRTVPPGSVPIPPTSLSRPFLYVLDAQRVQSVASSRDICANTYRLH